MQLNGQTIALGVCGGIAAYRACDLIRELYRRGAGSVRVLMTPEAVEFVSPLTLESLSRGPVYQDALAVTPEGIPVHIALAQQASALLILPATANMLAKLAHGFADDLVSTTALTFTHQPVVLAPAMNHRMWQNPVTRRNVDVLSGLENITIVPPISGDLACGETGDGHLAPQELVLQTLYREIHPFKNLYKGVKALVSAGGMEAPIDPVRVLTNRSSGKMGLALADELYAMGADVTLVGRLPEFVEPSTRPYSIIETTTARTLQAELESRFEASDLLVMAAAVSDFEVSDPADAKIKRENRAYLSLELDAVPDILAGLAARKTADQVIVGFAAETAEGETLEQLAKEKLIRKHLDAIVANNIAGNNIGFATDDNAVTVVFREGETVTLPQAPKPYIARDILLNLQTQCFFRSVKSIVETA